MNDPRLKEWLDIFPARLTARQAPATSGPLAGVYLYSATEQYLDTTTGEYIDAQPARTFNATGADPLREVNNHLVDTTGQPVVWARYRGEYGGQHLWEFSDTTAGVGSGGIFPTCPPFTSVRSVCPVTGGGSPPTFLGLIVEYQLYDPGSCAVLETWCVTNPTDCCESDIVVPCCGNMKLPGSLPLLLTQVSGSACSALDGFSTALVWSDTTPSPYPGISLKGWYATPQAVASTLTLCVIGDPTPQVYLLASLLCDRPQVGNDCTGWTLRVYLMCSSDGGTTFFNPVFGPAFFSALAYTCSCSPFCLRFPEVIQGGLLGACSGAHFDATVGTCPSLGSGSGSGSGSGMVSGIPTVCCPGGIPATLYATIIGTGSTCLCVSGHTFTFTWNLISAWISDSVDCDGSSLSFSLTCDAGIWHLTPSCDGTPGTPLLITLANCDPVTFSCSFRLDSICGDCSGTVGVIIITS